MPWLRRRRKSKEEETEFAALMFRSGMYENVLKTHDLWTEALEMDTNAFLALAHVPISYAEATPILNRFLETLEAALAEGGCEWAIDRPDLPGG
jgi:hypothetical protein